MSNEINLLDKPTVTTIIREIEQSEDRERKYEAFKSWQVYSGNVDPYVLEHLQSVRTKSYAQYTRSNISVSKLVTDKLSKAYKAQPVRSVEGDKQKSERLFEIYEQGDAFRQLPYTDTVFNLQKYSLMWVNYLEQNEQYQFMSLQPYEHSVIRDKNTGELTCVILNYGNLEITSGSNSGDGYDNLISESQADSSAQSRVYAMWSKDNHVIVKVLEATIQTENGEQIQRSIEYVEIEDNPLNENKIGIIPFVYVAKELAVDYPTRSPLTDQTIRYNYLMTEALGAASIQVGQLVLKYPERQQGQFDKQGSSLMTKIELPQSSNPDDSETTADYINPSPDLEGQKQIYSTYLRQILAEHGIESGSSISGDAQTFSSGLERAIANASVQDIVEKNQENYQLLEKGMFEIIKAWEEFLGASVFKEDDRLAVVFPKPKVLVTDGETLTNIEKRMQLGLMEPFEALMELDPNLSEKDAKEKLTRINESKINKMGAMIGGTKGNIEGNQAQPE